MKNKLVLDELDLGIKFSEDEMRTIVGGDDTIDGGQYGPGVTIYPDPVWNPTMPGVYYNPSTGGHDSAAPSTGGGGGGGSTYVPPTYTGGPGDHHLATAKLPKPGNPNNTQIPNYCVYQTIENVSQFFGGDINPGTVAGKAVEITGDTSDWISGFSGTVDQLNQLITTYFNGAVTTNVAKSIDAGNPVMAYMSNGDGTGHDVMITGYNNDGTYSYFDPQLSKYASNSSNSFKDTFAVSSLKTQ